MNVLKRLKKIKVIQFIKNITTWKKITIGEADSIRMMLSGKAKLEGDMAKVMKYTRAAAELTVSAQQLDIEWL